PRQFARLRDPQRVQRLAPVARVLAFAAHDVDERDELRLVRRGEPFEEAGPGLVRGGRALGFRGGDGRAVVEAYDDRVELTGEFHADVVARAVAARRR